MIFQFLDYIDNDKLIVIFETVSQYLLEKILAACNIALPILAEEFNNGQSCSTFELYDLSIRINKNVRFSVNMP